MRFTYEKGTISYAKSYANLMRSYAFHIRNLTFSYAILCESYTFRMRNLMQILYFSYANLIFKKNIARRESTLGP